MYFLDTDTLTLAHAGHPRVSDQFRRVDPNEVAITVITRIEILQGRFAGVFKASDGQQLVRAQELLQRSEERLRVLEIIPGSKGNYPGEQRGRAFISQNNQLCANNAPQ